MNAPENSKSSKSETSHSRALLLAAVGAIAGLFLWYNYSGGDKHGDTPPSKSTKSKKKTSESSSNTPTHGTAAKSEPPLRSFCVNMRVLKKIYDDVGSQKMKTEWKALINRKNTSSSKREFLSAKEQKDFLDHIQAGDVQVIEPPCFFKYALNDSREPWKNQMKCLLFDRAAAERKQFVELHVHYVGEDDMNGNYKQRAIVYDTLWFEPFSDNTLVWQVNVRHPLIPQDEQPRSTQPHLDFRRIEIAPPRNESRRPTDNFPPYSQNATDTAYRGNRGPLIPLFQQIKEMHERYTKNQKRFSLSRAKLLNLLKDKDGKISVGSDARQTRTVRNANTLLELLADNQNVMTSAQSSGKSENGDRSDETSSDTTGGDTTGSDTTDGDTADDEFEFVSCDVAVCKKCGNKLDWEDNCDKCDDCSDDEE